MACILPVFLVFIWGILEVCHAQLVSNVVQAACRTAARYGTTEGVTTDAVRQRVRDLAASVVDVSRLTILVKDASVYDGGGATPMSDADYLALPDVEVANLSPRDLLLVRVTVPYSAISLGSLRFTGQVTIRGQAFMRHE